MGRLLCRPAGCSPPFVSKIGVNKWGCLLCRLAMCSPIDGMALSEKSFWLYRFLVLFFLTALSTNRAMKREHVYSKCIRCGWRQRPITVSGPVSFEEYFCKECGDQLLICVDVRNTKDRNKKDNAGHKRKKKTKQRKKTKKRKQKKKRKHYIGCCRFAWN